MSSVNCVLEGRYKDEKILCTSILKLPKVEAGGYPITKRQVSSYTIIDETNKEQYSFWKGALGAAIFGGYGLIAGIGGKKRKEYLIAIEWKNGEKSLICIDDEYYKVFVKSMF